jgi:hypothetical protein
VSDPTDPTDSTDAPALSKGRTTGRGKSSGSSGTRSARAKPVVRKARKNTSAAKYARDEATVDVPGGEQSGDPANDAGTPADSGATGNTDDSGVVTPGAAEDSAAPAAGSTGAPGAPGGNPLSTQPPAPEPPTFPDAAGGFSDQRPADPPPPADPRPAERHYAEPPPPTPPSTQSPRWTSTVQPSGTAVNQPSPPPSGGPGPGTSPYGPAESLYGPSEVSQPSPPPPSGAPPPVVGRIGQARTTARTRPGRSAAGKDVTGKTPRKAHLQVSRFEPWSVMKFSFIMSLVCFVVLLVAVTVLYVILSGLGVFDAISSTINDLTREQGAKEGGLDAGRWFSFARVFGYTALVGALNVLLITALATVWAVIYNLAADFAGGVEVTLKEAE